MTEQLRIAAPIIAQQMDLESLKGQLPGLSDNQVRTEFIRQSLEYGTCGDLAECGIHKHLGEAWPEFGLCVLEVTDEGVRDRFDLAPFYVYRGVEIERRAEAVPFKNLGDAVTYFQSEEAS